MNRPIIYAAAIMCVIILCIIIAGCQKAVKNERAIIVPGLFKIKKVEPCRIDATVEIHNVGEEHVDCYLLPFKVSYRGKTVYKELFEGEHLSPGETQNFHYILNISCETLASLGDYTIFAYAIDEDGYLFGRCNPYKCESPFIMKPV